jgi:hypothetical protein
MRFATDFESFLRAEVNLNQTRLDTLQERVNAISDFVANHVDFTESYIDTIPAGSWAHRTIIKPVTENDEFDGDVLLYMQEQPGWLPKDYVDNLYAAFRSSEVYKPLAKRMKRCVRIDYAGDSHIDVVPFMDRGEGHFITYRLEPEGEGRFEASNPEAFTTWVDERQRITRNTFVKAVRLIKYLRDFKNTFSCKSIILMTLLGNEVNEIESSYDSSLYADTPSTFVTLLNKLAESLPATMPAVMDPAETGDNFTDRYKDEWDYANFRKQIIYYADKAKRALKEDDRDESISLWQEIFGDDFKPGALTQATALAPLSASLPWTGEQFIDQHYPFIVRLQPTSRVRISARCTGLQTGQVRRRNGFRQFNLSANGNRVSKNRSLLLRAAVANIAAPYEVYWKVRNGGQEAAEKNQLRGEISKDAGNNTKTESTLYKGTHYVECYVVQNGQVIAKDRQTVIVGP